MQKNAIHEHDNKDDSQQKSAHIISDIEVLRAAAILFTLFHHRDALLNWTNKQYEDIITFWGGVDLFLVISGFVIARGLLRTWQTSSSVQHLMIDLVAFWIKRIWRIWPTSLFGIFAVAASSLFWGGFVKGIPVFVGAAAGVANIQQYMNIDIGLPWPLRHYWSLSLEEQFYLIFPIVLIGFFRSKKWLIPALTAAAVLQIFLPRPVWGLGFAVRSDALILGILVAATLKSKFTREILEPVFLRGRPWLCVALTLSLLFLNATFAAGKIVPFFLGAIAILSAILVFIASYDANYIWPEGSIKKLLVWIGSRSYAIYVIHMPVYFLTNSLWRWIEPSSTQFNGHFTIRFVLTACVLVFGLSELNYRFIETPLRRRGANAAKIFRKRHYARLAPTLTTGASET